MAPSPPAPLPWAGEGSVLRGQAVLLVAFAGLEGFDRPVDGQGDEQRPGEVAVVLGEVQLLLDDPLEPDKVRQLLSGHVRLSVSASLVAR